MPSGKNCQPRSLRARLLRMFVTGMVISAGIVTIAVLLLAEPFRQHMLHSGIQHYTESMSDDLTFDANGQPTGLHWDSVDPWVFTNLSEELTLRILDDRGRVAYSTERGATRPLMPDNGVFDASLRAFAFHRDGVAMHGATRAVQHEGKTWLLQFAVSDRLVLIMRENVGMPAVVKGVALTCLAFVLLFFVTVHLTLRGALRPLRTASADARRITPRTLDERLDVDTHPVEIRPLVEAFNQTLDRLQHGFRTQQEFLASAAHELKTPLALIRAQVELGPRDERSKHLLGDVDRMARQVQQLLMLAEVSEPQNYRIEPIEPHGTVQEVFDFMGRVAERRGVHLGLRIDEDLRQWQADRGALFTLLKNLLENAIQHSPPGSVVALSVRQSGCVIRDQGPGLTDEQLPRIFERFWRGPDRREDGAGLGLSICAEIATAHRWRIEARNTGEGLEMRVNVAPADAPGDDEPDADTPDEGQRASSAKALREALF